RDWPNCPMPCGCRSSSPTTPTSWRRGPSVRSSCDRTMAWSIGIRFGSRPRACGQHARSIAGRLADSKGAGPIRRSLQKPCPRLFWSQSSDTKVREVDHDAIIVKNRRLDICARGASRNREYGYPNAIEVAAREVCGVHELVVEL